MTEPEERPAARADGPEAAPAAEQSAAAAETPDTGATGPAQDAGAGSHGAEDTPVGWLPDGPRALFGDGADAAESYGLLTVDVPAASWTTALETARDRLGCAFFDWLSAVDEPGAGFLVCAHVVALPPAGGGPVRRLLLRTAVPHERPVLPTATGVYAGAGWHERETHEMFGLDFTGHPHLEPLLLPDGFEGHPLRKDFVLAARVAKAWPGAKEPGESGHGGPKRRQMLPPGVPDPNEWGPLKGQLPPVPSRPARGRAGGGERPARRTRSASAAAPAAAGGTAEGAPEGTAERPVRRNRSASAGSASQRAGDGASGVGPGAGEGSGPAAGAAERPVRRNRSASAGSASQRAAAAPDRPADAPGTGPAEGAAPDDAPARAAAPGTRSSDAPWHHARPAHDGAAGTERSAADDGTEAGGTGTGGTGTGTGAPPDDGPDPAGRRDGTRPRAARESREAEEHDRDAERETRDAEETGGGDA